MRSLCLRDVDGLGSIMKSEQSESNFVSDPDRVTHSSPSFAESLQAVVQSLAELTEYAAHFLAAKLDQLKLSVRSAIIYAILGILGVLAVASVLVVSVVLLMLGIAHGLGAALGGRDWLGDLIVGVAVVFAVVISAKITLHKITAASRRRTVQKYEQRRAQQAEHFGRSANDAV